MVYDVGGGVWVIHFTLASTYPIFIRVLRVVSRKPLIFAITIKQFEGQSELLDSVKFYIKIPYDVPTKSELELVFVN